MLLFNKIGKFYLQIVGQSYGVEDDRLPSIESFHFSTGDSSSIVLDVSPVDDYILLPQPTSTIQISNLNTIDSSEEYGSHSLPKNNW